MKEMGGRAPTTDLQIRKAIEMIIRFAVGSASERASISQDLAELIRTLDDHLLFRLLQVIEENRVASLFLDIIQSNEGNALKTDALRDRIRRAKWERNDLAKNLSLVLSEESIDYVFFKTFSEYADPGVDIDLLIDPKSYQRCTKVLMAHGYFPIDNLSKTYATGFMKGTNPTIVDLHTDITVMGMSYFSPSTIFRNCEEIPTRRLDDGFSKSSEDLRFKVLNEKTNAIVIMAHSIMKEGRARASDIIQVHRAFRSDNASCICLVQQENLEIAYEAFARILLHALPDDSLLASLCRHEKRGFFSEVAEPWIERSVQETKEYPIKVASFVSFLSLVDRMRHRKEVGIAIPKALSSIRYRRSMMTVSHKIMSNLSH